MNATSAQTSPASSLLGSIPIFWTLLIAFPTFALWWWTDIRWRVAKGEPPLVVHSIPWLGHGLSFMNDINGFTEWVKSIHPSSSAATVHIAGQRLYLIFDTKLASQVYRRSQTFIFDPFFLQASGILGANKKDMKILSNGAQTLTPTPKDQDSGQRVIHDLHNMTPQHLTGVSLDKLTNMFIDVICKDIDEQFPEDKKESYEWETLDLCEFVKKTWCHASITALFGTHIYEIWPGIDAWLWKFDKHFQSLFTEMPRIVIPTAFALLDEGQEMCEKWESDAIKAGEEGKMESDPDWDEYWGLRFVRLRNEFLRKEGLSAKFRAGNQCAFLWGVSYTILFLEAYGHGTNGSQLNANAIPIAMQTIVRMVLSPPLLASLVTEVSASRTEGNSFDLKTVTTAPLFKSVYLESLRWATASPSPRVVRQDCEVGPYLLRKGNMAIVHSRTLQMDEETWYIPSKPESHPSNFWAERFVDGDAQSEELRVEENNEAETNWSEDINSKHPAPKPLSRKMAEPLGGPKSKAIQQRMLALRPFGGGTTLCPGRHFATNEIMGGLAALMLRLEIEVDQEALERNGTPVPDLSKQGGLFPDRGLICRTARGYDRQCIGRNDENEFHEPVAQYSSLNS
ncbi:hypothetical protein HYALB_00001868 [Hymenoscyphus albidus]|uniref:Cytochrome P450 n=1 Tax=Hymenoscyphus albidus TaxID=595503 RepID=A0A9N9Q8L6_9HELO|nr:hypothetical protein HYALB_00001868 [Hymenoscyphus albidus]